MSKRKIDETEFEVTKVQRLAVDSTNHPKKYSLDSDEEDEANGGENEEDVLDENDIEGEEDGVPTNIGEERFTAFNMREEMEEGHFDKDGHFIWNNEKEVRDNWLDNIDWQKLKPDVGLTATVDKGLGDESDEDVADDFEEVEVYRQILTYMRPLETINKALRRLGEKNKNLSSIERLKRKKAGLLDSNNEVVELTELADKILSVAGNMDVYQETHEQIAQKIAKHDSKSKPQQPSSCDPELDMYSDDFSSREKQKKLTHDSSATPQEEHVADELTWEFKWKLSDETVEGPHGTSQMLKWASEGHFKDGVMVRKCEGEDRNFYTSNRIDFELYM